MEPFALHKSSQSDIPKSARDILLSKVGEIIIQATQKRASGENEDALSLYQRASEILLALSNNETDSEFKANIEKQLNEINADKESVALENNEPSAHASNSRRESTVCEVVMSIENILGLGGPDVERKLIGKGLLRILRSQPPFYYFDFSKESPKLPTPQVSTKSETEVEAEVKKELATIKKRDGLSLLQLIPVKDDTQFQFPLTKSVPCLCTAPGYYIFPMPDNLFYGLVFPSEIPQAYVNIFEGILEDCCTMRKILFVPNPHSDFRSDLRSDSDSDLDVVVSTPENSETALTTINTCNEIIVAPQEPMPLAAKALTAMSSGINTGANALVEGITNGSYILAATARTGGEFIRTHITPSAEPAKVPEPVVYVAGKLTPVCVAVSKVLISSLAAIADEVGKTVAKGLAPKNNGKPSAPSGPTANAAKQVGKSSLQAFVNVWDALEQAGELLLKETSSVTVDIVDHKFGAQAAQVTKDAMDVTGDIITTAYNINQLGAKKIVKKAAKQAGKHTVGTFFGPGGEEQKLLEAPEEKLALPAPEERLALPAPEDIKDNNIDNNNNNNNINSNTNNNTSTSTNMETGTPSE